MKKLTSLLYLFVSTFMGLAQDSTQAAPDGDKWSMQTKVYILIGFVIFSLVLVFRTFRGKPDA